MLDAVYTSYERLVFEARPEQLIIWLKQIAEDRRELYKVRVAGSMEFMPVAEYLAFV